MEETTYKGREGKREREGPPVITVPPGSRGARIVTARYRLALRARHKFLHLCSPKFSLE